MHKLMIVDDEPQITELLKKYFEKKGYAVSSFTNPNDALSSITQIRPDVVLLDIMMPEIDGIGVLEHIAQNASYAKVIMMTAGGDLNTVLGARKLGAHSYILKPFGALQEVEDRIKQVLA